MDQEALNNLERLHRLKGEGIITEEEFEQAKRKCLFGSATPKAVAATATATAATAPALPESFDDHLAWITLPLKRYADFDGRSTRREFWMFQLIPTAIIVIGLIMISSSFDPYGDISGFGMFSIFVMIIALLGLIVPQLAVQARRFHDQGRSGWLVIINLVPYIGTLIVLIFMLLEGTEGENEYGPDPLSN